MNDEDKILVQVSGNLGTAQYSFTGAAAPDQQSIFAMTDLLKFSFDREWSKHDLEIQRSQLAQAKKSLSLLPGNERNYLIGRAKERAALLEGMQQLRDATGRREFKMSKAEREGLADFDKVTAAEKAKYINDRAQLNAAIPALEAKIERLKGEIAGRPRGEAVEDEIAVLDAEIKNAEKALPEAAD